MNTLGLKTKVLPQQRCKIKKINHLTLWLKVKVSDLILICDTLPSHYTSHVHKYIQNMKALGLKAIFPPLDKIVSTDREYFETSMPASTLLLRYNKQTPKS